MARTADIHTPLGEILARKGVTVVELAKSTGLGYTHLWRVVSGERPLTQEVAARVATALDVQAQSLFTVPTTKDGRDGE